MSFTKKGFTILEVLIAIVVIAALAGVFYYLRGRSDSTNTTSISSSPGSIATPTSEPDIALENLGLTSLDSVLVSKNAMRDYEAHGLKGFYIFGDSYGKDRAGKNPNFEFASLKEDTKIVAAIDGIIGFVRQQSESNDYEVFLQPKEGSIWTIGYDHLINVTVKRGDTVKVGDLLGNPARQNNGNLRFEIQVNKGEDSDTVHYCPSTLLDSSVKDTILADLKSMQESWESVSGKELYTPENQNPIGCLKTTMTPAEAEK